MANQGKWRPVNLSEQGFDASKKPVMEGPGPFIDHLGNSNISGNTLIRNWKSGANYFLIFFALIWNTFIAFFVMTTWNGPLKFNGKPYSSIQEAYKSEPFFPIMFILPLFGVFIAYVAICFLINKTKISVENGELLVKRGPLPWFPRSLSTPTNKIRQVYVEQYSSHSENKRPVISFRVMAQLSSGEDICVDKGFSNYSSARILEQWLENKLRIEDKVVPGEVGT